MLYFLKLNHMQSTTLAWAPASRLTQTRDAFMLFSNTLTALHVAENLASSSPQTNVTIAADWCIGLGLSRLHTTKNVIPDASSIS